MARVLTLLLVLAAVAVSAGCGSSDSEPAPDRNLLSAGQVTSEFQEETGDDLRSAAGTDPSWEQFNFGLNPPPKLVKEYGIFTIYVVAATPPNVTARWAHAGVLRTNPAANAANATVLRMASASSENQGIAQGIPPP